MADMGIKRTAVLSGLGGATVFGFFWHELFAYARSLVYDWILMRLAARVDPNDPRVKALADFLALCGPILLVAVIVAVAVWLSAKKRFTEPLPTRSRTPLEDYERAIGKASAAGLVSSDGTNRFFPPTIRREKGDRDTPLAKALGYALNGDWDTPLATGMAIAFTAALNRRGVRSIEGPLAKFREAAHNGELRVWGRRQDAGLFELIDPEFWGLNTIDPEPLISFLPAARTVYVGPDEPDEQFHDIMVNRFEVERVWPHAG